MEGVRPGGPSNIVVRLYFIVLRVPLIQLFRSDPVVLAGVTDLHRLKISLSESVQSGIELSHHKQGVAHLR